MHYNTIQQMNTCIGAQTETKQYTQQTYTGSIVPTNLHSGKMIEESCSFRISIGSKEESSLLQETCR